MIILPLLQWLPYLCYHSYATLDQSYPTFASMVTLPFCDNGYPTFVIMVTLPLPLWFPYLFATMVTLPLSL
jgi:hypothetical protein